MNTKFISIDSVLQDLSTVLPEEVWNTDYLRQWAYKGAQKLGIELQYENYICMLEVSDHEAYLPTNWKYINMIVGRWDDTYINIREELQRIMNLENEDDNPALAHMAYPERLVDRAITTILNNQWLPLRRSSSPFMKAIHCDSEFYDCPSCQYEYVIESSENRIITTLKEGTILVSYKSFPTDKENMLLIPDNEDVKEAIFHYCMYRYYLTRVVLKDQAAYREREWHLNRYQNLLLKSKSLNLPDVDTLENITQRQSRLIKWADQYQNLFTGLGDREQIQH